MDEKLMGWPAQCDVLVVGAGPAGSAAAMTLARGGLSVVLADQHDFPRDKVCGDGLIPDAHEAMRRLGVLDEVMAHANPVSHVGFIAPRGGRLDVPGRLAVLPRKQLDDILCRAARSAGAQWCAPARFVGTMEHEGRVVGARLRDGDQVREVRAKWVVLATGASAQALVAAEVCQRKAPSGVALRTYVKNPSMRANLKALDIVWHRTLSPGYGWIFPCGDDVYNIGAGLSYSTQEVNSARKKSPSENNLRDIFDQFTKFYAPARELMASATEVGELKGAPLRCTLTGAHYSRPGLLVTGEAAGSTYSFTGEGIGKALETGILAAEAILRHEDEPATRAAYEASLLRLKPRFDQYQRANFVNAHPWVADVLVWRARKSERLLRGMAGVLEETTNPGGLVSWRGVLKLIRA